MKWKAIKLIFRAMDGKLSIECLGQTPGCVEGVNKAAWRRLSIQSGEGVGGGKIGSLIEKLISLDAIPVPGQKGHVKGIIRR